MQADRVQVDHMGEGSVVSLHLACVPGGPTFAVEEVRAVTGRGLEGDRNFFHGVVPRPERRGVGRTSGVCDITLIELEAVEALARETGIVISPADSRRNVVCRGVRLNQLVGQEFQVGEVTLFGLRLSEPCARLEQLVRPGLIRGLLHRGGLRAEIRHGGPLRVGDLVRAPSAARVTGSDGAATLTGPRHDPVRP